MTRQGSMEGGKFIDQRHFRWTDSLTLILWNLLIPISVHWPTILTGFSCFLIPSTRKLDKRLEKCHNLVLPNLSSTINFSSHSKVNNKSRIITHDAAKLTQPICWPGWTWSRDRTACVDKCGGGECWNNPTVVVSERFIIPLYHTCWLQANAEMSNVSLHLQIDCIQTYLRPADNESWWCSLYCVWVSLASWRRWERTSFLSKDVCFFRYWGIKLRNLSFYRKW